jgi:hypothetical protein
MKINTNIICFALVLGAVGCHGTSEPNKDASGRWIKGTVKHIELEGGFYGILTDRGDKINPVDLPDTFKQDGLAVRFRMKRLSDQVSFRMWGTLATITDIERL